jgi:hypothetical protein
MVHVYYIVIFFCTSCKSNQINNFPHMLFNSIRFYIQNEIKFNKIEKMSSCSSVARELVVPAF